MLYIQLKLQKSRPGGANVFTITVRMNCALSLAGCKINYFHPKILPFFNYEEE